MMSLCTRGYHSYAGLVGLIGINLASTSEIEVAFSLHALVTASCQTWFISIPATAGVPSSLHKSANVR